MRPVLIAAFAAAVLALAGCGGGAHTSSAGAPAQKPQKLVDLESTAQLTSLFDRAAGVPRLVLIVSPT